MADRKIELNIDLDYAKKLSMSIDYVSNILQELKIDLKEKNKQIALYQITISNFANENEVLKRKLKNMEELCQIANFKDIDIAN